ncbi:MAG: hypothetical protein JRJ44_01975 [Deltaproteobacteria bacterium]|nr:hypothetical protein [Deltaproteobacteria bacterium]
MPDTQFFNSSKSDKLPTKLLKITEQFCKTGLATDDEKWKNLVFHFLSKFYNQHIDKKIIFLNKSEKDITKYIRDWLRKDRRFCGSFIVNCESLTKDTDQEGYNDIIFESTLWNTGRSYFIFECKIIDETKAKITEYVYRQPTPSKKADGGLYRFLTSKYASGKDFGGMIGFVLQGRAAEVINKLKKRISELSITEHNITFGELTDKKFLEKKIEENKNSFLSKHTRINKDTNKIVSPILIYNILFDFTLF